MPYKFNPISGQFDYYQSFTLPPGTGDVQGPASSTANNIPVFDDNTGKVIADSGRPITDLDNYSQTFVTGDWVLDVDKYVLTVTKATHGKDSPIVVVYEVSGSDFIQVETGVRIDSSENIILTVNAAPDLRFDGKLSVS
jgi:hypothetical protein